VPIIAFAVVFGTVVKEVDNLRNRVAALEKQLEKD
jgi:hypothetical protein